MTIGGHVKHLLTAYVHGELPDHLRQRVARHIQHCNACYTAMLRERDMTQLLAGQMPGLGARRPDQLALLLPDILAGAVASPEPSWSSWPGFGLVLGLVTFVVMALPVVATAQLPLREVPEQPAPHMIVPTATPELTDAPSSHESETASAPTAIAARLAWGAQATEPALLSPVPVPLLGTPAHE